MMPNALHFGMSVMEAEFEARHRRRPPPRVDGDIPDSDMPEGDFGRLVTTRRRRRVAGIVARGR